MPAPANPTITDRMLRAAMTVTHKLMMLGWLVRRPRSYGAHALALTPERRVVLVKLRYAHGWRLPGGGRNRDEDPSDAVVRELREEIGLTAHGRVTVACEIEEIADFRRDLASLLLVEDVRYRPHRWSLEIEQVIEVEFNAMPADLSPRVRHWIDLIRPHI
ncbi:MAG: NUDIX domain-containing protein [Sphingomicrobium sp.]